MQISADSIALVTGASSGIGRATALALGKLGCNVAITARRLPELEALATEIVQAGGNALVLAGDITNEQFAKTVVAQTKEHFGGLDILINNAGRGNIGSVEDTTVEEMESMFALNVYALFYTCAAALPDMKKHNKGSIVNISSVAGTMGFPFNAAYVAAKHAAVGFTRGLRAELADTDVHVGVVCPAAVDTPWAQVTEGGPIGDLFGKGIEKSRNIAKELGRDVAPLTGFKSPEELASDILDVIREEKAMYFTHEGTKEQAIQAVSDPKDLEAAMSPLYIGMCRSYNEK